MNYVYMSLPSYQSFKEFNLIKGLVKDTISSSTEDGLISGGANVLDKDFHNVANSFMAEAIPTGLTTAVTGGILYGGNFIRKGLLNRFNKKRV